jgi:molybdate transport system permease protein
MSAELVRVTFFSVTMALLATAVMLPPGVGLAWLLAKRQFPGRTVVETVVSLPLVLPPVATGLILLQLLGRRGPIGRILDQAGVEVIFTWKAVVVAMAVMGLPLLVRAARAGFDQVDQRFEQIAATLGASPTRVFFSITLPLARRGVMAGSILGFSRALGEFGATMMIAGALPGTRTLSTAIYSYSQTGRDTAATALLVAAAAIAFVAVFVSNRLDSGHLGQPPSPSDD